MKWKFSILSLLCGCFAKEDRGKSSVSLIQTLQLQFSDQTASPTLQSWARMLSTGGNTVTHATAVRREQEVVHKVNTGIWSPSAFHEYQRLAAGTGNVDSARLLMDYGITGSLQTIRGLKTKHLREVFSAVVNCDFAKFKKEIKRNKESEMAQLPDGTTLLIAAVDRNCSEIVNYLVEDERDIDEVGMAGVTALMVAASRGHVGLIRLLVEKGHASLSFAHKFAGTTALHMAAELNQPRSIRALCLLASGRGEDISMARTTTDSSALHAAAHVGSSEPAIAALLRPLSETQFQREETVPEELWRLVDDKNFGCGIDPDVLMNADTTSLYLASQHGHASTVAALLQHGANPHFVMPNTAYRGGSHIMRTGATSAGEEFDVDGLIPINSEPGNGAQALHAAAEEGHVTVIQTFIHHNRCHLMSDFKRKTMLGKECVDLDSMSMGVSALHLAVQYNRPEVVKELIAAGANASLRSYVDGGTPLYYACGKGYLAIAQLLLSSPGVTPAGQQHRSGTFPLYYAAASGHAALVKELLRYGANAREVHVQSKQTGLHAAISAKSAETIATLLASKSASPEDRNLETATFVDETTVSRKYAEACLWKLSLLGDATADLSNALHLAVLTRSLQVQKALFESMVCPLSRNKDLADHWRLTVKEMFASVKSNPFLFGDVLKTWLLNSAGTAFHDKFKEKTRSLLNQTNALGLSPIHSAILHGNWRSVGALLAIHHNIVGHVVSKSELFACPNSVGLTRVTPKVNKEYTSGELVSPLVLAVRSRSVDTVSLLLNWTDCATSASTSGATTTPLLEAIATNQVAMVSILLESRTVGSRHRTDPNVGVGSGVSSSPLLIAVTRGSVEIVRLLLENGANCAVIVSSRTSKSEPETLVDLARRRRDYDMLQELMKWEECHPENILKGIH